MFMTIDEKVESVYLIMFLIYSRKMEILPVKLRLAKMRILTADLLTDNFYPSTKGLPIHVNYEFIQSLVGTVR